MTTIKQFVFSLAMPVMQLYWRICKPKTNGVRVLITDSNLSTCLLVLHSYGNRTLWNIPGGGYKPERESAEEAACREVFEEIGVSISVLDEIGSYQTATEGKQDTVILFHGTLPPSTYFELGQEIAEVRWVNLREAVSGKDVARVARRAIENLHRQR